MESEPTLTIGAAARLAGVTVRTLHHHDDIGLVSPAKHTDAGYRLYRREEIERRQEVLFLREVGMGLDDIRRMMDEQR
jgi:DNA-binding transcriptional MerR regulator